jgi:hypothetical protein
VREHAEIDLRDALLDRERPHEQRRTRDAVRVA